MHVCLIYAEREKETKKKRKKEKKEELIYASWQSRAGAEKGS